MGNGQLKERQEYVTFEIIQDILGLNNPLLFKKYLKEVFNDLGNSVNKNNKKYMTRLVFYDYIKLPIFIAEKLFRAFSKSSPQGLCEEEFVDNFFKLYMGTFEETAKIVFDLLDFDKNGKINKDDVKIVLSYLPINEINEETNNNQKNENKEKKEKKDNKDKKDKKDKKEKNELITKIFGTQMKSLEEIDKIVSETFNKCGGEMDLEEFTEIVTEKNSDIFLQILCFLYVNIPFSPKNIEAMKTKYNMINDDDEEIYECFKRNKKSASIRIKTPKHSTLLSPAGIFLKKFQLRKFSLNDEKNVSSDKNNKKKSVDSQPKIQKIMILLIHPKEAPPIHQI